MFVFIQIIFFCKELNKNITTQQQQSIETTSVINNTRTSTNSLENLNEQQNSETNFCILCQKRFLDILKIFKEERDLNKQKYLIIILVVLLVRKKI